MELPCVQATIDTDDTFEFNGSASLPPLPIGTYRGKQENSLYSLAADGTGLPWLSVRVTEAADQSLLNRVVFIRSSE